LNDAELTQLLRNSLEASFAPETWKTAALADFDDKAG
jgi:adenosine deaminase